MSWIRVTSVEDRDRGLIIHLVDRTIFVADTNPAFTTCQVLF